MQEFRAHGDYRYNVMDRLLYISAYGPWNREAALSFDRKVRELVSDNFQGK